jgi:hypothetical protein
MHCIWKQYRQTGCEDGPEEPETGQYSMALSQDERASTDQVSAPPVGRATPDIVASTHVIGTGPIIF